MPKERIYTSKADYKKERRRIDFSSFDGISTSRINTSSVFKADWDLFEVVTLL